MPALSAVSKPLAAAFALVAAFYFWTVSSDGVRWRFGAEQTDYYNLLVDGFLDGQLSLKAEPSKELLACPDPYDPARRPPGSALHDASFYRGRYYIYYGVVPAVVLLLPFRLITGTDLPIAVAVLGFTTLGYLVSLTILAAIRRRYFPESRGAILFLLAVALGVASFAPILLRRHSMYELPIACGYFFSAAALLCSFRALWQPERRITWVALASVCWGLAIGSRPTYILAPLALAGAVAFFVFKTDDGTARRWRMAAAAFVPLSAIGAFLALYNFQRFGNPFEFGVSYILSGVYESKVEHFSLRYLPWNLQAYFFSAGNWGRYFPFYHGGEISAAAPAQHYGMDFPVGVAWHVPFLWLAVCVPLGWRRLGTELRIVVLSVLWVAGSTAVIVLGFYAAMARYLGDFAPALALLACVGGLALHDWAGRRWAKFLAHGLVAASVAVSLFAVATFSVRIYDRVRQFNPALYRSLARIANAPVHALERLRGDPPGAMTLEVMLPPAAPARERETLLATGWGNQTDRVRVRYREGGQIAFAYEHAGAPAVESAPLSPGPGPHRLRISIGSLMPAPTDPVLARMPASERNRLLRRLRVEFDGQVVLDRYQRFYDASPGSVRIGGRGDAAPFSGKILKVERERISPATLAAGSEKDDGGAAAIRPDARGSIKLRIRFPAAGAGGREPLIVTGETGRADFVVVEYLADGKLRFLLDHWGSAPKLSEPVDFTAGREYQLEITHQAYAAMTTPTDPTPLRLTLDGRSVWECTPQFFPVDPDDFFVGFNPLGGSSCGERFTGTIAADAAAR